MGQRPVRALLLDVCTAALLLVAAATLVHDRLLPMLAERARLDPGDEAGDDVRFRRLGAADTVGLDPEEPSLVVVFRSTCPVCDETAPDWRLLAALAPQRTFAMGLDADSTAAAWIADRIPGVSGVVPLDPGAFLDRLRIRAVPTTLLFEGRRLALARVGPLQPDDRARIRRAFAEPVAVARAP